MSCSCWSVVVQVARTDPCRLPAARSAIDSTGQPHRAHCLGNGGGYLDDAVLAAALPHLLGLQTLGMYSYEKLTVQGLVKVRQLRQSRELRIRGFGIPAELRHDLAFLSSEVTPVCIQCASSLL